MSAPGPEIGFLEKLLRRLRSNKLPYYVGIDLGTTKTAIAFRAHEDDVGIRLMGFGPERNRPFFRSTVRFEPASQAGALRAILGEELEDDQLDNVRETEVLRDRRIITRSKLHMGQGGFDLADYEGLEDFVRDSGLEPEMVSAILLHHARRKAEEHLGELRSVTITVPASWSPEQRRATKAAALVAGFEDVELLEEPVAALIALLHGEVRREVRHSGDADGPNRVMVIDFGGGTCDVAVVELRGDELHLIGGAAEDRLGGEMVDDLLTDCFLHRLDDPTAIDRLREADSLVRLKRQIESYKIKLNNFLRTHSAIGPFKDSIILGEDLPNMPFELSRDEFRELLRRPQEKLVRYDKPRSVHEAFRALIENMKVFAPGEDLRRIKRVFLVGGSSRLFFVRGLVAELFGRQLGDPFFFSIADDMDQIVARGAALHQFRRIRNQRSFTSILPYDIGLEIGDESRPLLERGHPLHVKGAFARSPLLEVGKTLPANSLAFQLRATSQTIRDRHQRIIKEIRHDKPIQPGQPFQAAVRVSVDGIVSFEVELYSLAKKLKTREPYPVSEDEGLVAYRRRILEKLPSVKQDSK